MSVPVKTTIDQITEGSQVAPSIANNPHLDLEDYVDSIHTYLYSILSNQFDNAETLTNGLDFHYTAGKFRKNNVVTTIPLGFVTLTANETNYIQINNATSNVISNISGFDNNNVPLWEIVTDGTTMTSITNVRTHAYSLPQALTTTDDVTFNTITITDASFFNGDVTIGDNITDNHTVNGSITISSALDVTGATTLTTLNTSGNVVLGDNSSDTVDVSGILSVIANSNLANVNISGNLNLTNGTNSATFAGDINANADVIIAGNLTVNGTTVTVNSTTVTIDDPVFTLGGDVPPVSDDDLDRGVEFNWHDGATDRIGFMGYSDANSKFVLIANAINNSEVFTPNVADEYGSLIINSLDLREATAEVPPMTVVSTTVVENLNADKWDGGDKTISVADPTGGVDGDVWFQY